MADTFIAGGTGNMSGANTNGGGFLQGGTATYATCQDANGGPTSVGTWNGGKTACSVYNNGLGSIRIGGPGAAPFANCVDGTLVYIDFLDTYSDDWYVVLAHTDTTIDIGDPYSIDSDCDCHVGGAFAADGTGIAQGLSLLAAGSGDQVHVATNPASPTVYPVAAEITMPAVAGTAALPFRIYGVDYTDGTELTDEDHRPILQATEVITSIWSWVAAFDYCNVEMIDFDGNIDKATYCWCFTDADGSTGHTIKHCRFHRAISHGVYQQFRSDYCLWFGNKFDNNGECGLYSRNYSSVFDGNVFQDNTGDGVWFFGLYATAFVFNKVFGNGGKGINGANYHRNSIVANNVIFDNTGDGINIFQSANWGISVVIVNNTIFSNGGYAINNSNIGAFNWPKDLMQVSNNHSWDNALGHCREMDTPTSDVEWLTFMDGKIPGQRNITGDPEMVDPANADFTLKYSSPLLRAGIGNTDIGAGGRLAGWGGSHNGGFAA